jgi:nucleotide-binding universal stress UspA family protein
MKMKQILCGVDFSEASVRAFETAVELAQTFKAELHVIHTIEADPSAAPNLALEAKATSAMDALVAPAQEEFEDVQLTSEVTTGSAFVEILSRARERHCDLITLGAKGVTMLGERLVGSTSEHVVKEAPCSVLIVRA